MVLFKLEITAELENLTDLQPNGGVDDPNFTYYFKMKCDNCGEVTSKETCVSLNETVPLTKRGTAHLVQKCKFCSRDGSVTMLPGEGKPLTDQLADAGKYAPLMLFEFRGYQPVDFAFSSGWSAQSVNGTKFVDIDLSGGEFAEYDEDGGCPVTISNPQSKFVCLK